MPRATLHGSQVIDWDPKSKTGIAMAAKQAEGEARSGTQRQVQKPAGCTSLPCTPSTCDSMYGL